MKSPEELSHRFSRQWENPDIRESRLLNHEEAWPISLSIGRPKPSQISSNINHVKCHVENWRKVEIGSVVWEDVSYRATATPVKIPIRWELNVPSEWATACHSNAVSSEFRTIQELVKKTDPSFHSLLLRRRSLWQNRPVAEVIQAARLAMELEPGSAAGLPLRAISAAGIDTKFFERNAQLITNLLDVRFDGEASLLGIESFLGCAAERDHWLLVADLDGSLLPFKKQRVASAELETTPLPGKCLIIVENETCLHQLPSIADTVAVLGSGFDLAWTKAPWLENKRVAYWGDIDTWGLQLLSSARVAVPHLEALLMSREVFLANQSSAVQEPTPAPITPPSSLSLQESALYQFLLQAELGRLEQEFLAPEVVEKAVARWVQT